MFRVLVFVCFIAFAHCNCGTQHPDNKCPKNERFVECVGCQNTCANPDIAARCRVICKEGCVCREGWFRNSKGVCVPPENCDSCGPNEIFSACGNTNCVNTCEEPQRNTVCMPERCIAGCICKPGFLKTEDRACVAENICKNVCGANEVYRQCTSRCSKRCANYNSPFVCLPECGPSGCDCKAGFIRGWKNECILPNQCPTCPGANEFYTCDKACQTECATLGEECMITTNKCGCYCNDGFARNAKGICVPTDECPPRQCPTDPNAIILPCGDPCPLTCETKEQIGLESRPCPAICLVNGCKCKDGFVLGKDKKCIAVKDCPQPIIQCKENEVLVKCESNCQKSCISYFKGSLACVAAAVSCRPGCHCKDGYVRNSKGACVLPANCCEDKNSILVAKPNPCKGGTCAKPTFEKCNLERDAFGCECKTGFVKKSEVDATCVDLKSCRNCKK